jgi:S1-C subfamily serine protease
MEGAFVGEVTENSAAEKAGIKKEDIIIQINGVDVKSAAQLQEQVGRYSPGDKITVTVLRDNKKITLNAELKNRQGNTGVVSSNTNIDVLGATFKEPDSKTKAQFQLSYGMEVKSVSKGKFQEAGIKPGFVIVKINNQAIRSTDDIESVFDAAINTSDQFKDLNIAGIYPNGKVTYYAINLAD